MILKIQYHNHLISQWSQKDVTPWIQSRAISAIARLALKNENPKDDKNLSSNLYSKRSMLPKKNFKENISITTLRDKDWSEFGEKITFFPSIYQ